MKPEDSYTPKPDQRTFSKSVFAFQFYDAHEAGSDTEFQGHAMALRGDLDRLWENQVTRWCWSLPDPYIGKSGTDQTKSLPLHLLQLTYVSKS